jgi:hypothetical protein
MEKRKYGNIVDGAKGVLGDCVRILSRFEQKYVVIGGWSPFLLNSKMPIEHPGTKDVDLLFEKGAIKGNLHNIFKAFLLSGYKISAKHQFQLLKVINVGDKDFVYNVDFLHAENSNESVEMFVDHLELAIPIHEYKDDTYVEKSINAPHSDSIFHYNLFDTIEVKFDLPDDTVYKQEFPLMNEAGLLITKSESLKNVKRKRDSLDIYIAITQARDYKNLVKIFSDIKKKNAILFNTLYGIKEELDNGKMVKNILDYLKDGDAQSINDVFAGFFEKIGLPDKAKSSYD